MVELLNGMLAELCVPEQDWLTLQPSLGKTSGGERLVALMGMCYMVLMRERFFLIARWGQEEVGAWCSATKRSGGALYGALRRSVKCEV